MENKSHEIKKLKTCFVCKKVLIRNEKGKLVCPDESCRDKIKSKKKEDKFVKGYRENITKVKSISKIESEFLEENAKRPYMKKPSAVCNKCGGYIRKNYSHGRSSKSRVSGHRLNCPKLQKKQKRN